VTSPKMTRSQAAKVASAACKVPEGIVSDRGQIRLAPDVSARFRLKNATHRGQTYALGEAIEANGFLLLYKVLDRLGVRIINTIVGSPLTIVCRHKTYKGDNQAELLLEILRDRLNNVD
jgi:hypothetical protein